MSSANAIPMGVHRGEDWDIEEARNRPRSRPCCGCSLATSLCGGVGTVASTVAVAVGGYFGGSGLLECVTDNVPCPAAQTALGLVAVGGGIIGFVATCSISYLGRRWDLARAAGTFEREADEIEERIPQLAQAADKVESVAQQELGLQEQTRADVDALQRQHDTLLEQHQALRSRLDKEKGLRELTVAELEKQRHIVAEMQDLLSRFEKRQATVADGDSRLQDIHGDWEDVRDGMGDEVREQRELIGRQKNATAQMEQLLGQIRELVKEKDAATAAVQDLAKQVTELRQAKESFQKELALQEKLVATLDSQHQADLAESAALTQALRKLEERIAELEDSE